jgi:hypothetical protein
MNCGSNIYMFTSPNPMRTRTAISHPDPALAARGEMSVKKAVLRIPTLSKYFPPHLSARIPPGK